MTFTTAVTSFIYGQMIQFSKPSRRLVLSPPVYMNTCHIPRRNTVKNWAMGRDPLEVQKCLKNKGKTRGTKSLVTEVNNCPGFARSSLNIIVNCTSSLDMGEKKWRIFHLNLIYTGGSSPFSGEGISLRWMWMWRKWVFQVESSVCHLS